MEVFGFVLVPLLFFFLVGYLVFWSVETQFLSS